MRLFFRTAIVTFLLLVGHFAGAAGADPLEVLTSQYPTCAQVTVYVDDPAPYVRVCM